MTLRSKTPNLNNRMFSGLAAFMETERRAAYSVHTCHYYILALKHGVKYIYQTMPRMLTLWLDLGEHKERTK